MQDEYQIPALPLPFDIETKAVMKKTSLVRTALGEMKGAASGIPNKQILINTLSLQESKDSSAIENIITTQDELYQSDFEKKIFITTAAKEVYNHTHALLKYFNEIKENNLLTINQIIGIRSTLVGNDEGFRKSSVNLKHLGTNAVVYIPPLSTEINQYMRELEQFINDNTISDLDPLVKMAIIHHQFESIHPFSDGNGRVGRIINILYLVKENLLDAPILYMSRYINNHKDMYYVLLQEVRNKNTAHSWEKWIMFILEGVEQTSRHTIDIIKGIKELMLIQKNNIRNKLPNIYNQSLLNNIFMHPYTKIDFMMKDLNISRNTTTKYLEELINIGVLQKEKYGRDNYYVNTELYNLLSNVSKNYPLKPKIL